MANAYEYNSFIFFSLVASNTIKSRHLKDELYNQKIYDTVTKQKLTRRRIIMLSWSYGMATHTYIHARLPDRLSANRHIHTLTNTPHGVHFGIREK